MVSYFSVKELSTIGLFALLSSLINFTFPIKHITEIFNIPGPASGMCIFGGIIFVFWICLAHRIIKKRYSAILTSVFISAFCLFFSPQRCAPLVYPLASRPDHSGKAHATRLRRAQPRPTPPCLVSPRNGT